MKNLIFCIVATFSFLQASSVKGEDDLTKKEPQPQPGHILPGVLPPVPAEKSLPPPPPPLPEEPAKNDAKLRLILASVDVANNLWREEEKGELFLVIQVPESADVTLQSDKNDSKVVTSGQPCTHHVQDVLFPKGFVSAVHDLEHKISSKIPSVLGGGHGPQPVRRYIKDRAGRTFFPFVDWYYNDPCYYGGPGCYPPPGPYYPPPPPYYPPY